MDGTLLNRSGEVHPADRDAIGRLQKQGVRVSIVTGRLYSGTRAIARSVGIDGPVGCVDGSHIVCVKGDRHLVAHAIDETGADYLRRWLAELGPVTYLLAHDSVMHDEAGKVFLRYLTLWSHRVHKVNNVLGREHFYGDSAPMAVVAIGRKNQIIPARARIEGEAADHLQGAAFSLQPTGLRGLWGLVVRAAGPSKATAFEWIGRHYGARREDTIAVGDWWNDVPMLRAAGRSFAMGQAPAGVAAAATERLEADNRTGGGIAEAARRAGLL